MIIWITGKKEHPYSPRKCFVVSSFVSASRCSTLFLPHRSNRTAHHRLPGHRDHLDRHTLHRTQQRNPMLQQQDDWEIWRFLSKSARKHRNLLSPCSFLHLFLLFGPGSYIKAAEKSFSMVKGGRIREAAALAWERQGPAPDRTSYKNWAKSLLDNPAVVDCKVKSNDTSVSSILQKIQKQKSKL